MNESCPILIVDDDPGICTSLRDILAAHGFQDIEIVSCGRDALAACQSTSYDVVLLDMKLPDMSGLDLVPQLEERLPAADILVITGYASQDNAAQAVRPSTVAYLTKPIDLERLLSIIERIAERKQLERENQRLVESLRLAKLQWERTFDAISDPIIICDETGTIQRINRAFSRRFSTSFEDAVGVEGRTLLFADPLQADELPSDLHSLPCRQERDDLAAAGVFEVSCDSVELSNGDGVIYALRDITEKKQAEEELRRRELELFQAQKMETVGRLASGIAHDFNNLLTIILSETDLALGRMHSADPLRGRLGRISQAAERSTTLSKRLLGFGQVRLVQPQVCDLNTTLREAEGMLRRLIGAEIELRMVLATDLGEVSMDPAQLEQILVNLVSNARDAMPGGGILTLETANGYPSEISNGESVQAALDSWVTLSVVDTGVGIDQETRGQIFEPFFTTKERGTGLGLSTVYGIMEQSEGMVRVASEQGAGATFRVTWPRAMVVEETPRPVRRPPERSKSATVLFVDDNEAIRNVALEMLTHAGYQVLSAENGRRALEIVASRKEPVDIAITDVLMPKLNGPEFAEHLQELHPQVPVLFISGFPDRKLPADAMYLQKPFSMRKLLQKVHEILAVSPCRRVAVSPFRRCPSLDRAGCPQVVLLDLRRAPLVG